MNKLFLIFIIISTIVILIGVHYDYTLIRDKFKELMSKSEENSNFLEYEVLDGVTIRVDKRINPKVSYNSFNGKIGLVAGNIPVVNSATGEIIDSKGLHISSVNGEVKIVKDEENKK